MLRRASNHCCQRPQSTSSSPNQVRRSSSALVQSYNLGPLAPFPALNLSQASTATLPAMAAAFSWRTPRPMLLHNGSVTVQCWLQPTQRAVHALPTTYEGGDHHHRFHPLSRCHPLTWYLGFQVPGLPRLAPTSLWLTAAWWRTPRPVIVIPLLLPAPAWPHRRPIPSAGTTRGQAEYAP